jgi:hypothetical protein
MLPRRLTESLAGPRLHAHSWHLSIRERRRELSFFPALSLAADPVAAVRRRVEAIEPLR